MWHTMYSTSYDVMLLCHCGNVHCGNVVFPVIALFVSAYTCLLSANNSLRAYYLLLEAAIVANTRQAVPGVSQGRRSSS